MFDFRSLYEKYWDELYELGSELRPLFHRMQRTLGCGFQDLEGEVAYMVIRETKPEISVEISPGEGWSTNYLLSAISRNGTGRLHSFELRRSIFGQPSDALIRSNLVATCAPERLEIHIGDARRNASVIDGEMEFLLLDSCHEEWFAKWYTEELFPRVNGEVLVQDIAYSNRLFDSTEASYLWAWLRRSDVGAILLDSLREERGIRELRSGLPTRQDNHLNSLLIQLPKSDYPPLPSLDEGPFDALLAAKKCADRGDLREAGIALDKALSSLGPVEDYDVQGSIFCEAGAIYELFGDEEQARYCFGKALGCAMLLPPKERVRELVGLCRRYLREKRFGLLIRAILLVACERNRWPKVMLSRSLLASYPGLKRLPILGRVLEGWTWV